MATGLVSWSKTASDNATADSTINFAEGQAPSSVNDSARALMASVAKWRDDNSGSLVTGGTATAYTVTTNQGFASLSAMNGQTLRLQMNATCGDSPTLNVDGLGAKPIWFATSTAVGAGALRASQRVYSFIYDNTNGAWIVYTTADAFPSGTVMLFQQTAAPTGWTKQTTHNDKALRIVSGTASSGGTAAFTTAFTARTISQANLPNVNFSISATATSTATVGGTGAFGIAGGTPAAAQVTNSGTFPVFQTTQFSAIGIATSVSGTAASGGSGTAMDFTVQYVDVIAAIKN